MYLWGIIKHPDLLQCSEAHSNQSVMLHFTVSSIRMGERSLVSLFCIYAYLISQCCLLKTPSFPTVFPQHLFYVLDGYRHLSLLLISHICPLVHLLMILPCCVGFYISILHLELIWCPAMYFLINSVVTVFSIFKDFVLCWILLISIKIVLKMKVVSGEHENFLQY